MKAKALISSLALGFLTLTILTVPVLATYTVTLTLTLPTGETLYTATWTDVENLTLTVPEPLYLLIYKIYGKDTFTAPFELSCFVPMVGYCNLTVISDPEGFTVTFEKMEMPDFNGDGKVDIFDLVRVARSIEITGRPENYDMFVDLNFDLTIDIFDLVEVAKNI
ncbi:MAG: dockerin type I domain-containing protein [Candidatus Bathyarchaeaceae archaeon]